MSINHRTSEGQARDQEAAVQRPYHPWEKQLLLSFSTNGKDNVALTSLYFAHNCTKHRPRFLPSGSEAMPHENHL